MLRWKESFIIAVLFLPAVGCRQNMVTDVEAESTPSAARSPGPVVTATATPLDPNWQPEEEEKPDSHFSEVGGLALPRTGSVAVALPDGRIFVTGGYDYYGTIQLTAEVFDPGAMQFRTHESLTALTYPLTANLLEEGRVLVTGKHYYPSGVTKSEAEVFDPVTGSFVYLGAMNEDRTSGYTATRLDDDRILFTGGQGLGCGWGSRVLRTSEIYDPGTGRFTAARTMRRLRSDHNAVKLRNGQVLITGGNTCIFNAVFGWTPYAQATAEIYDPSTGEFREIDRMHTERARHLALLRPDGKVLLIGGDHSSNPLQSIELFDPETETFTAVGSFDGHRAYNALLLDSGKIFIVDKTTHKLYDLETRRTEVLGKSYSEHAWGAVIRLDDRRVFLAGGGEGDRKRSEIYTADP